MFETNYIHIQNIQKYVRLSCVFINKSLLSLAQCYVSNNPLIKTLNAYTYPLMSVIFVTAKVV